jgi:hypothetical protein
LPKVKYFVDPDQNRGLGGPGGIPGTLALADDSVAVLTEPDGELAVLRSAGNVMTLGRSPPITERAGDVSRLLIRPAIAADAILEGGGFILAAGTDEILHAAPRTFLPL